MSTPADRTLPDSGNDLKRSGTVPPGPGREIFSPDAGIRRRFAMEKIEEDQLCLTGSENADTVPTPPNADGTPNTGPYVSGGGSHRVLRAGLSLAVQGSAPYNPLTAKESEMRRLAMTLAVLLVGTVFVVCAEAAQVPGLEGNNWRISEGDETFTLKFEKTSASGDSWRYGFHYRGITIRGGGYLWYNKYTHKVEMVVQYGQGLFRPIPNGTYYGRRTGDNKFYINGVHLDGNTKTLHFYK